MTILLIIILILCAIIVSLLFLPYEYRIKVEKYEDIIAVGSVNWLFGIVKVVFKYKYPNKKFIYVSVIGIKKNIDRSNSGKSKKKSDTKEKKHDEKDGKFSLSDLLEGKFVERVLNMIKTVYRHIKPKKIKLNASVGFEDPYYTGMLCGIKNIYSNEFRKLNLNIETFFDREILEGILFIRGRIIPGLLIYPALRLYLSKPRKIKSKKIKSEKIKKIKEAV